MINIYKKLTNSYDRVIRELEAFRILSINRGLLIEGDFEEQKLTDVRTYVSK